MRIAALFHTVTSARPSRRPFLFRFRQLLALSRSRRDLALLDDHLLQDIGLTREEAEAEASRSDWDVPPHWLR